METDYYRDSDLTVGGVVNLWGRSLLLCDCDKFTKEYYRSKYGVGKYQNDPPHIIESSELISVRVPEI